MSDESDLRIEIENDAGQFQPAGGRKSAEPDWRQVAAREQARHRPRARPTNTPPRSEKTPMIIRLMPSRRRTA
jgi:hypothetical protein